MTANTNLASSPDSSSDSSINNQPVYDYSMNMDSENCLPTVVCTMNINLNSKTLNYVFFTDNF